MLVWWKISNEHLCCFPCNMWLMGPFLTCVFVDAMVLFGDLCDQLHLELMEVNYIWGECVSQLQNKYDNLVKNK